MTKRGKRAKRFIASLVVACALAFAAALPALADDALGDVDTPAAGAKAQTSAASGAQSSGEVDTSAVQVSKEGDAAALEGSSFAISDFSRAQKGSNRSIDGEYRGYAYLIGQGSGQVAQLVAVDDYVVAYIPQKMAQERSIDFSDSQTVDALKKLFCALDAGRSSGSVPLTSISTWYFTTQQTYAVGAVRFQFDQDISGKTYALVIGTDGSDVTDSENANYAKPSFADFGAIAPADSVTITAAPTGLAAMSEFLQNLDWSPLWVSLRTTGIAIVFIVILGLLAAYFCLNLSSRAKSIFDAIFTIPMVLPPTVCGFILLFACGSNTAFGRFWIETGFPLIFSPAACVIAAVVVAFPLMYREDLRAPDAAAVVVEHRGRHGAGVRARLGRVRRHAVHGGQLRGHHAHHPHCHLLRVDERQQRRRLVLDGRYHRVLPGGHRVHQPVERAHHQVPQTFGVNHEP